MGSTKTLVVFDFDGTITTKDSYIEFIKHCFGSIKTYLGFVLLAPVIVLYKLKILRNDVAKQVTFTFFFKGMTKSDYLEKCSSFRPTIDSIVRPKVLEQIAYHKAKNHELLIVSASMEEWISPWAKENYFETVIGTKPEVVSGKLTGKFITNNCYGEEKVVRLKQHVNNISEYYIHAYGDSSGDKQLLDIADEAFYRHFDINDFE